MVWRWQFKGYFRNLFFLEGRCNKICFEENSSMDVVPLVGWNFLTNWLNQRQLNCSYLWLNKSFFFNISSVAYISFFRKLLTNWFSNRSQGYPNLKTNFLKSQVQAPFLKFRSMSKPTSQRSNSVWFEFLSSYKLRTLQHSNRSFSILFSSAIENLLITFGILKADFYYFIRLQVILLSAWFEFAISNNFFLF